jgi:hypothetical protein
MKWDVVGPLLLGAALTLTSTMLVQWANLTYQTRRQRQARQADRQATRLLALQDLLGEVEEAVGRAMGARAGLSEEFDQHAPDPSDEEEWKAYFYQRASPELTRLRSLTYRLRLLAAGVEHEPLRNAVWNISQFADRAPRFFSKQEAENTWVVLIDVQNKAVELLGEQLRKLP